jgi:c-di-GMP-binding flagellar brake protein YcgR
MSPVEIERIDERRRAVRVDALGRAYVTERRPKCGVPGLEETLAPIFGEVLNVSATGALLAMPEPLPPGRAVVVGLEVDGQCVEAPAVVMRVARPRSGDGARVGLRFARLTPRAESALGRLIRASRRDPLLN